MDTLSVSLAGMNAAKLGVAVVANTISNASSKDFKAKRGDFGEVREGGVEPSDVREGEEMAAFGGTNVELTNLLAYADTYKINSKVLEVQQEILGTVMDLKV